MRYNLKYIFCVVLIASVGVKVQVHAQDRIDKEIVVVKPYQPSLSDAFKINVLPRVSDSISITPSFDYSIEPKKFETKFQVRPITPARLVASPLTKLYKSYLKLGFGNYLAPLAELNINSLREKESQWGIALKHYSINGKLKLENGQKVNPGFMENSGSIYGKKIFDNSYLAGSIGGAYEGADFYGYHHSLDTVLQKDDIRQTYLKLDGRIRMGSTRKDSLHLNWSGTLDYLYTYDHYKNFEHAAILDAKGNQRLRSGHIGGLGIGGAYYYTSESIDSGNNIVVNLNPWFGKTTREYTYRMGVGLTINADGDKTSPHFYPEGLLQINIVEGILMPYFGFDGKLQVNNYRSLVEENRYISPALKVDNTSHKIRGYMGLKGSFSKQLSYDLSGSYTVINKMPFFVNDTMNVLGNSFNVIYDNLQLIRVHGEVNYRQTDRLSGLLSVTYDHYNMDGLEHPWHKPNLIVAIDEKYNLKNKIIIDAGLYFVGKRYAPGTQLDTDIITLKGFADLNLGIEYRYTKILSGFVRLNNILGTRYQTWNQYPGMGFNVLFGFTYAL
ncbi:hypothetical protein ACFLTA_02135 [Bacteroidota bacterium]